MIIPESYWAALILLVVSLLCAGSWATAYKACGPKWRFELYYFDFVVGVLLLALGAAFTLGQFGSELSFLDNIAVTGKRQLGYAVAGGLVFNLGNMLLLAGVALVGMATAFPSAIGIAMLVRMLWGYTMEGTGSAPLLFGGLALILVATGILGKTYISHANIVAQNLGKKRARGATKGVIISLVSGFLLGSSEPVVALSRQGDIGLGPYTIAAFFAAGMFFSTFVFNIYFMNLPVQGKAVEFGDYFKGEPKQHLLGLAGGFLFLAGLLAALTASAVPPTMQVDRTLTLALTDGAALVAALWGLAVWKEFSGSGPGALRNAAIGWLLWAAGLGLLAFSIRS